MKTIQCLILLLALVSVRATAQESQFQLWMDESLTVTADGVTVTYLTVSQYDPEHNYLGFNMEFMLPKGFKINQVKSGRGYKNDIELSVRATDTHTISCNMPDERTLKVACISTQNQELYPDDIDGNIHYPLFTVGIVADPTTINGVYEVEMSGISFTWRNESNTLSQKVIDKLEKICMVTVVGGTDESSLSPADYYAHRKRQYMDFAILKEKYVGTDVLTISKEKLDALKNLIETDDFVPNTIDEAKERCNTVFEPAVAIEALINPLTEGKYLLLNDAYTDCLLNPTAARGMVGSSSKATRSVWKITPVDGGYTLQNELTELYAKPGNALLQPWSLVAEPQVLQIYPFDGNRAGTATFGVGGSENKMHEDAEHNVVNSESAPATSWRFIPYAVEQDVDLATVEAVLLTEDLAASQKIADLLGSEISVTDVTLKDIVAEDWNMYKPFSNKYYRFANVAHSKSIGVVNANPVGVDASAKDINQLWQMVPNGKGFRLYNPNQVVYMPAMDGGNAAQLTSEANATVYQIEIVDETARTFRISSETGGINMEAENENGDYILNNGNAENAVFTAAEANTIEVDLKEASIGGAYASVYLPFAVTNEDSEVKAYVAKSLAGNVLLMTETMGIQSKAGFILKANSAKVVVLKIGVTDTAENSLLSGTTSVIALDDTNRAKYLLFGEKKVAEGEAGELGFYKPAKTITDIAANKAFLSNDGNMANVRMQFDFIATDIENVNGGNESNKPAYDLSGIRAKKLIKGNIYTRKGQKFMAK